MVPNSLSGGSTCLRPNGAISTGPASGISDRQRAALLTVAPSVASAHLAE
jgi:hypothetical protein